jgi:hypothetical protein
MVCGGWGPFGVPGAENYVSPLTWLFIFLPSVPHVARGAIKLSPATRAFVRQVLVLRNNTLATLRLGSGQAGARANQMTCRINRQANYGGTMEQKEDCRGLTAFAKVMAHKFLVYKCGKC